VPKVINNDVTHVECSIVSVTFSEYKALPEDIRLPQLHKVFGGCGVYRADITEENIEKYTQTPLKGLPEHKYIVYLEEILGKLTPEQFQAIMHHEGALMILCDDAEVTDLPILMRADAYGARMTSPDVMHAALIAAVRATVAFMHEMSPEFNEEAIFEDIMAQPEVIARLEALKSI